MPSPVCRAVWTSLTRRVEQLQEPPGYFCTPNQHQVQLQALHPQPHTCRDVPGAKRDSQQPGPILTFLARWDKPWHSHSHGSWRPRRIPGPHPCVGLQIIGDTPCQPPPGGAAPCPGTVPPTCLVGHPASQDMPTPCSAPGTCKACHKRVPSGAGDGLSLMLLCCPYCHLAGRGLILTLTPSCLPSHCCQGSPWAEEGPRVYQALLGLRTSTSSASPTISPWWFSDPSSSPSWQ